MPKTNLGHNGPPTLHNIIPEHTLNRVNIWNDLWIILTWKYDLLIWVKEDYVSFYWVWLLCLKARTPVLQVLNIRTFQWCNTDFLILRTFWENCIKTYKIFIKNLRMWKINFPSISFFFWNCQLLIEICFIFHF